MSATRPDETLNSQFFRRHAVVPMASEAESATSLLRHCHQHMPERVALLANGSDPCLIKLRSSVSPSRCHRCLSYWQRNHQNAHLGSSAERGCRRASTTSLCSGLTQAAALTPKSARGRQPPPGLRFAAPAPAAPAPAAPGVLRLTSSAAADNAVRPCESRRALIRDGGSATAQSRLFELHAASSAGCPDYRYQYALRRLPTL